MKRLALSLTMLACLGMATPVYAAGKPAAAPGKPTHVPLPAAPGTTSQPLGNNAIVRTPGQPPKIVVPSNRGVTIQEQGKPDVQCQRVGETYRCR
jgi:hypothetical protein